MSRHVAELLPLEATGGLDAAERGEVVAHLAECAVCATEAEAWRRLVQRLERLSSARPSPALAARTRAAADLRLADRAEQTWNRAALGFLIAFAWILVGLSWMVMDLLGGGLARQHGRPMVPTFAWYAIYEAAGFVATGVAAVFAGWRVQEQGRTA
jgi:anti-sigma factor RsiW